MKIHLNGAKINKYGTDTMVMFEKKVVISDDALIVGDTKIFWNDIAGLREQDSPLLKRISNRFPRAEIFLKCGKVIVISNIDKFQYQDSSNAYQKEANFQYVVETVKNMVPKEVTQTTSWFEWRLLLPIAIIEIFIGLRFVLEKRTFEETVNSIIIGGILGAVAGWVWERQERKKKYSKT